MLLPALDLCSDDADFGKVLDAAESSDFGGLGEAERTRLAKAANKAGRAGLALSLAQGSDGALIEEVTALLTLGELDRAESRYRAGVRDNPALEAPELLARIEAARAQTGADSNIVALSAHRGSASGPTRAEEVDHARLSFAEGERIDFSDVGGHADIKKQIERRIIAPFKKPALFAKFRRKAGGGVLLYGPPGCGKTLLARATAGECEARFINVPVTDVLDKYIGEPARKLAAIFEAARRQTPCVLFLDELDGFAQNNDGVLILAATNMPWAVDPAFRRSGRFDRLLFVPPPDRDARAEIMRLQLDGRPIDASLDLEKIAKQTAGYSGADLRNLADTAADFAIEASIDAGEEVPITPDHFAEALTEVKATTGEWLTTARNFAKYGNSGGQYDEVAKFIDKYGK